MRELHKECGDKLQILSISGDKDKTDWQNAIEKLNLTDWPQLIENYTVDAEKYYFAEQAEMSIAYRVEQIPRFILIDKNGTITGRWPHLTPDAIKESIFVQAYMNIATSIYPKLRNIRAFINRIDIVLPDLTYS